MEAFRDFREISEKATEVTTSLFVGANTTPSLNLSNDTMDVDGNFIYSPYAKGISGVFAWTALILACFQVNYLLITSYLDICFLA